MLVESKPGSLLVVGSGELTPDILRNTHGEQRFEGYHDTFLDAPLQVLPEVNQFRVGNESTDPRRQTMPMLRRGDHGGKDISEVCVLDYCHFRISCSSRNWQLDPRALWFEERGG